MNSNQHLHGKDYWAMAIVAFVTLLSSLIAYRPTQLYFFGDTWDILCEFREAGWPTIWRMHNEHFMPISKALLYVQYQLFGMFNLPYQLFNLGLHAINAALVYVLAGEFTAFAIPRVFGALVFSFSTVYWELTMWEAGQQTTFALLFVLLGLALAARFLTSGDLRLLAFTTLSALLASWSMGFGLLMVPLLGAQALIWGRPHWKRAVAVSILPLVAIGLGYAVLLRTDRSGLEFATSRASLSQALRVIPWTYTGLRGLAASYVSPLCVPAVLCLILLLVGLFFWRSFATKDRLLALIVPVLILVLPYVLTSFGRVQLGIELAASSRYHYLPAAALGLISAWVAGGIYQIAATRRPRALFWLGFVMIVTLPFDATSGYEYARMHSPFFEWARQGRRFVDLAVGRRRQEAVPTGMVCVSPEMYLPFGLYPPPFLDLTRVLPLYAVPTDSCSLRLGSILGRPELNEVSLLDPDKWGYEGAAGAYTAEASCASTTNPYSFAASVKLKSGDPSTSARLLFKDSDGRVLETYISKPIASSEFTPVVVSAYPAPNTATVSVDVGGGGQAVIALKNAVLVEHPVLLLQEEVTDKHGVDPGRVKAAHSVAGSTH